MKNTDGRPRSTLPEKVVAALREKISSNAFAVGEKLPREKDLVAAFGVSRTVIREALAQLSADGLVAVRHGVGAFVLAPAENETPFLGHDVRSIDASLDLFELRRAVETEAAGLAAVRRSPAQEAKIRDAYHKLRQATEGGDPASKLDFDLHRAIAEATNNGYFVEFLNFLAERAIARNVDVGYGSDQSQKLNQLEYLRDEHRKIVEAISLQDPELARATMRAHLLASESRFRALAIENL